MISPMSPLPRITTRFPGIQHFKEELTGPEYAGRFVKLLGETGVEVRLDTMVLEVADDRRVHMVGKSTG